MIDLHLSDLIKRGEGYIANVTANLIESWEHSVRAEGGYWMATAEWQGSDAEKRDMFLESLGRVIKAEFGGLTVWQGFVGNMVFETYGQRYEREWQQDDGRGIGNRSRVIYSRIGDNELTNGSSESGAWASYGGATTTQSTAWVSDKTYSTRIETSGGANKGAVIQTGITLVEKTGYDLRCTVNIISGTWKLAAYRTDNGETLGQTTQNATGQVVMKCSINEDNTYTGAVELRLICTDASGECYGDGAVFQQSARRAETQWYEDTASQDEWGVLENVLIEAGMTDEAANALAQTYLAEHRWPRTVVLDDEFSGDDIYFLDEQAKAEGAELGECKLEITFYGDVFTLANLYTDAAGTSGISALITEIIGAQEFVTAGAIETNATEFQVENRGPLRCWEVVRDAIRAGDDAGKRWMGGVYAGRTFNYGPVPTTVDYKMQRGVLLDAAGAALEGYFAAPGYIELLDMPVGPEQISGAAGDNPRVVFMEEITYRARDGRVTFRRNAHD